VAAQPVFLGHLGGRAQLRDPNPVYKQIRDLGPAVWLPRRHMWAIGRFDDIRPALRADSFLVSGRGVAANSVISRMTNPITLTSAFLLLKRPYPFRRASGAGAMLSSGTKKSTARSCVGSTR
jgi:cytochrome P450